MPTAKPLNHSDAGKGDDKRLPQISREEEAKRWDALQVVCPACGQKVIRRESGAQECWRCGHKWTLAGKEA